MSYEQKPLKKVNGMPVPQYWNHEINDWEIVEGSAGAYRMNSPTKVAKEPFSASANLTKEFTSDMHGIVISNDGNADLTFTIAGETYTVKAGEVYEGDFEAFRSVIVNSTAPFRAHGKKAVGSAVAPPSPADTTAPDNVTNVTATSVAETTLTLNWTASVSTDTAGYDIYRGTTLLSSVTGTTFNVTGLAASTQYTFTVKAKDGANNIATGLPFTVTTAAASADTTPPNNVTNLTAASVTHNSLTLSWSVSSSSDVASYEVYRGTTLLGTVTGTTYNVTGLTAATSYTFAVKAKDASSNVATGTSVTVSTAAQPADTTPPADVTGLTAGTPTQTGVSLSWTASASTDIKDYNVYNGTTLLATVTTTTYGVTGLTANTAYTFVVKARDTANNESAGVSVNVITAASAPPADTTPPEPVTGLTAGTVMSSSIPVNWTLSASSDVANYELAYSTDAGATYTVASAVVNASSTSYTVTGLNANTAYMVRVVAIDSAGNRSTGVTVTASTEAQTTKYLSLNGTSDYIKTPSFAFDEIVIDFKPQLKIGVEQYYMDTRTGHSTGYFYRGTANTDSFGVGTGGFTAAYVDGISKSNASAFVPTNQRIILRMVCATTASDDVNFFSNNAATPVGCMQVEVYDIKLYNAGTLVAHYNMNTGTVQDQSGNGRHATLNGGAWLTA